MDIQDELTSDTQQKALLPSIPQHVDLLLWLDGSCPIWWSDIITERSERVPEIDQKKKKDDFSRQCHSWRLSESRLPPPQRIVLTNDTVFVLRVRGSAWASTHCNRMSRSRAGEVRGVLGDGPTDSAIAQDCEKGSRYNQKIHLELSGTVVVCD